MSFYKCQKCQKAWQYPIERCPDCFSILERSLPGKAKVVGVSQVKVSTILHPQTPFFALVLEDENGNRWTHKSSIEYKIGDEVEFSPSVDKNAVAIWRTKHDILEAIDNLVGLLGGLKIGEDSKILVLPSINSSKHPYLAENTSPQFLEAMIDYLLSKGAKSENIKIAAQSFNDVPAGVSATKSQLIDVCKNKKVEPIDLAEKGFVKKGGADISELAFSNDIIINLPILGLNAKKGIISATENLLKLAKKESYLGLKYLHDEEEVTKKIIGVLPEILNVAEAIYIQRQDKANVYFGLALASFNSFNLDRVFAETAMIKNLPAFLKEINLENILVVGRSIKEVQIEADKLGI